MSKQIDFARENGYVETIMGRRRYLTNINSQNGMIRSADERNAINAPIQGTAADIIKLAMIEIHENILSKKLNAKMLLQVHDELVFEIEDKYLSDSLSQIKKIMEKAHLKYKDFRVPLIVDHSVGNNWGESY